MEGITNGIDVAATMALHNRPTDNLLKQPIEKLPPVDGYLSTGPGPLETLGNEGEEVRYNNFLPNKLGILRNLFVGLMYTYAERGARIWTTLKLQRCDGRCPHCDTNLDSDPSVFERREHAHCHCPKWLSICHSYNFQCLNVYWNVVSSLKRAFRM